MRRKIRYYRFMLKLVLLSLFSVSAWAQSPPKSIITPYKLSLGSIYQTSRFRFAVRGELIETGLGDGVERVFNVYNEYRSLVYSVTEISHVPESCTSKAKLVRPKQKNTAYRNAQEETIDICFESSGEKNRIVLIKDGYEIYFEKENQNVPTPVPSTTQSSDPCPQ